jgi:hypothetical protein
MKKSKQAIVSMVALGAILLANGARAQDGAIPDHPMMTDRYFLGVGALWTESNVQASLNSQSLGRLGTFIDFEDDLGLDESNVIGTLMFRMQLSHRWRLEAEYFKLDRDNDKVIARDINFGDLTFPLNTSVESTFDLQDARIGVGYAFFRAKDKEVGVGLGIHVMKLETSLSAGAIGSESADTSGPLPTLSVYARIALTDRWLLNWRVDRFSLDTGDFDGSILSTGGEFVYQPWRHFNIGIGFRDISIELTVTSSDWRGEAEISQKGPLLFVGATW